MSAQYKNTTESLRQRAEAMLDRSAESLGPADVASVQELAHELAVHQSELELQNEELRDTQQLLQEMRDRFAALYEHAPVGYVVLDAAGIIRQTNSTWQSMLNRPEDDLRGTPFTDTLVVEDAPIFLARFRAFFRNPAEKQMVVRMKRQDASPFPVRIEAKPSNTLPGECVKNNTVRTELMVIVSDITDLHQAQQELKDKNRELLQLNQRMDHIYRVLLGIRNVNQLIVTEEDPHQLIQQACECLTENMGYFHSWIALFDEECKSVVHVASSQLGDRAVALKENLEKGLFPHCMIQGIRQDAGVIVEEIHAECLGCPMLLGDKSLAGMSRCLRFAGKTYGTLTVSVSAAYAKDPEELDLFNEVAEDIAFALHKIELSKRLEESQRRYLEIFHKSRDGFVMVGTSGRIIDANQAYCEIVGYSLEEMTRMESFFSMTHEPWREWEAKEIWEKRLLVCGYSGLYEKEYVRKDGTLVPVELRASAVKREDGAVDYLWATVRDITERKQSDEELRKRESQLEKILEILPIGLWFADKNGKLIHGNPAGVRIWGAEPLVPLAEYGVFKAWRLPSREPLPPDQWALAKTIREGVVIVDELLEIESFDGKRKTILNYTAPVLDDDGNVDGAIVVNLDISDRKNLENQLVQAQKIESVGRLAGGVAHDFNNMLSVILGHVELMLADLSQDSPLREGLEEIQNAASHSAELTRQLLAFARRQTVAPKNLNLNQTVESMLKMLRRLIGEDIDLLWVPASRIDCIRMDPAQVDQLLANLCVNARDAIGPNGGKITIETGQVHFEESYCQEHVGFLPGDYVLLAVTDNGCGIEKDLQETIFEPFFTTKSVGQGTGLGLATAYGIVKQNNGFINLYSEPGRGSTFRIYFPSHAISKTDQASADRSGEGEKEGEETILLVEDEPSILGMAKKMLERQGYSVLAADRPQKAIQMARDHLGPIHLLMTDLVMPEMNGRDLAVNLTAIYPNIKCLFMSGYTANVIAHHGVLDEGVQFIQKPFSIKDLSLKIKEVLGK